MGLVPSDHPKLSSRLLICPFFPLQGGEYEDASMHYQHALALVREERAVDMRTVGFQDPI
jgi:hypothetical protein